MLSCFRETFFQAFNRLFQKSDILGLGAGERSVNFLDRDFESVVERPVIKFGCAAIPVVIQCLRSKGAK